MSVTDRIAIDIGTSYSRVAIFKDDRPQVLANELASNLTPSYVAYTDKLCHVGDRAKEQEIMNISSTVHGVRRLLGRRHDDETIWEDRVNMPYKFVPIGNRPRIQVNYRNESKNVTPEEVLAVLLERMVEIGTQSLKTTIKEAVITVPSQFTCCQRRAVKDAAEIVGIKSELINETTAAAVAYVYGMKTGFTTKDQNLLVFNMGGGFTTATIFTVTSQQFYALSTSGDMRLGGNDFDKVLVDHCCSQFERMHKADLSKNYRAIQLLRRACEKAKRNLSFSIQTTIEVDDLYAGIGFEEVVTREKFEFLCGGLFDTALKIAEKALKGTDLQKEQIDEIILVGGCTRMPRIHQQLRTFFNQKSLNISMNPDEAAVLGAAVYMARHITFQDIVPVAFGAEVNYKKVDFVYKKDEPFPNSIRKDYKINTSNDVIVKIFQGKDVILGRYNLEMGFRRSFLTLHFKVTSDGILLVEADAAGNSYKLPLVVKTFKLPQSTILQIKEALASYKSHIAEDSERILAKDARDMIFGSVDRLTAKLKSEELSEQEKKDYSDLRDTLSNWLYENPSAASNDYEHILETFSKRVAEIKKQQKPDEQRRLNAANSARIEADDKQDSTYSSFHDLLNRADRVILEGKERYGNVSEDSWNPSMLQKNGTSKLDVVMPLTDSESEKTEIFTRM